MATKSFDMALERFDQAMIAVREAGNELSSSLAQAMDAASTNSGVIDPFIFQVAIFVLSIFVGYYVVWAVTPALHTPLMAVTNAISSVIVVGALLAVGLSLSGYATFFGFIALVLASINIFGGFLVTHRMLAMYRKKVKVLK
ncbi:MAG: NAD(P) transhydrogenase subunit alpha [Candidatus Tokpelaia sp. JSC189]|nr:MAG: NAD(P) transhydrogenase subunit alpha [Candidatus Tokpelaia sp. JSC189]